MRLLKHTLSITLACGLVWLLVTAMVTGYYSRTEYTCLECRARLLERKYLRLPVKRITEEPYSVAYVKTHPDHVHHWCWVGSVQTETLLGMIRGCGKQHPIWNLSVNIHARYANTASASALDEALRVIDSNDRAAAFEKVQEIIRHVIDEEERTIQCKESQARGRS